MLLLSVLEKSFTDKIFVFCQLSNQDTTHPHIIAMTIIMKDFPKDEIPLK